MTFLATAPAHPAPPTVAIVIGAVLVLAMLFGAALAARHARNTRRALRVCPCCGARAVRQTRSEQTGPRLTRIALQCGQCTIWRRVVVDDTERRAQLRRLERDRRHLARRLRRVEALRTVAECRALRSQIVGAEDLLRSHPRHPAPDEERKSP